LDLVSTAMTDKEKYAIEISLLDLLIEVYAGQIAEADELLTPGLLVAQDGTQKLRDGLKEMLDAEDKRRIIVPGAE